MSDSIVKDSSIWTDPSNTATLNKLDGLIRIGIVKSAFNDADTGELRYLVEIQSNAKKINMNCRLMRRFGGVYNYEDYIYQGYKTTDAPDPVTSFEAKAGDAVLVGQLNGQGREGVILGGLTHAARQTSIQASDGPQYDSEFNGIHTNINNAGEWTLTFKALPTNISVLSSTPSSRIPAPQYNTTVGSSYMKFDKTGGFIVSDNATSDPQFLHIDKAAGTVTVNSGQISLVMTKSSQAVILTSKALTINSSDSIDENTTNYHLIASATAKFDSPKIAIGHADIELLDQITQLIDAIGKILPISPVGPCTALNTVEDWPDVEKIKAKINQIKGGL
jgi:phage gp45-like